MARCPATSCIFQTLAEFLSCKRREFALVGGEGGTGVRLDLGEGKDALHLPSWEALLCVPTTGHIHSHKCK